MVLFAFYFVPELAMSSTSRSMNLEVRGNNEPSIRGRQPISLGQLAWLAATVRNQIDRQWAGAGYCVCIGDQGENAH